MTKTPKLSPAQERLLARMIAGYLPARFQRSYCPSGRERRTGESLVRLGLVVRRVHVPGTWGRWIPAELLDAAHAEALAMNGEITAARLDAQIRREMVEALEHATFSTLPTYDDTAIDSALADGVIVSVSVTGADYQVYALTEARDRAAILHALADGPSALSDHPYEAVQAALRDGVIRAWGPSATGRTVFALAAREPVAS